MRLNIVNDGRPEGWLPGEEIPDLVAKFKNPIGLEIGTDYGWTTEYLLSKIDGLKLYGVDPYINYIDWNSNALNDRDYAYETFMKKLSDYVGEKYQHIRKTSDDAAKEFEDEFFDFIFIDGIHTYEQVKLDLANYYPKLKKGGLFCGHDYKTISGVTAAVDEFAAENKVTILKAKQDVWYWYKE